MPTPFQQAITAIDGANSADPNNVTINGQHTPKELAYAIWVTDWVKELNPDASDILLLAARGAHICRWTTPRTEYPEGAAGYHAWRNELKEYHADKTGEILLDAGYDDAAIDTVRRLIRKQDLPGDPDAQTLEDALCLVTLEHQLDGMIGQNMLAGHRREFRLPWPAKLADGPVSVSFDYAR